MKSVCNTNQALYHEHLCHEHSLQHVFVLRISVVVVNDSHLFSLDLSICRFLLFSFVSLTQQEVAAVEIPVDVDLDSLSRHVFSHDEIPHSLQLI